MSAAGTPAGRSGIDVFEIYTFQQDSSVQVAHPKGWTVEEHELGVTILEQQAAGSAGLHTAWGSGRTKV